MSERPKPLVLAILDGFGVAPPNEGNAITTANTPNFKKFITDLWFETVPVIYENHKLTFNNVDEIVEFVTIKSSINKDAWQEWFVFRTVREFDDDRVGRVSFKCISPEFLLKGGE